MRARMGLLMAIATVMGLLPAGALAAKVTHLTGDYSGLGCPSVSVCYTLSERGVVKLVDGSKKQAQSLPGFEVTQAISCAGGFCAIVGTSSAGAHKGVLITISHGKLGKPRVVPLSINAVSCPAAGRCLLAGSPIGAPASTIEVAVLSHGKLVSESKHAFASSGSIASVQAVSCASLSACELIGDVTSPTGGFESFFVGIGPHAKLGKVHFAPDGGGDLLTGAGGISCPPGGRTCFATGDDMHGGGAVYSLSVGGAALTAATTDPEGFSAISCISAKYCTAGTFDQNGNPAIVSLTDGQAGALQSFPTMLNVNSGSEAGFSAVVRTSASRFIGLGLSASSGVDVVAGTVS